MILAIISLFLPSYKAIFIMQIQYLHFWPTSIKCYAIFFLKWVDLERCKGLLFCVMSFCFVWIKANCLKNIMYKSKFVALHLKLVMSLCGWKFLWWDVKQQQQKQTEKVNLNEDLGIWITKKSPKKVLSNYTVFAH